MKFTKIILLILFFQVKSIALSFETGLFYNTDKLTSTSEVSSSKTILDFAVMMGINKKNEFVLGWSYFSIQAKDQLSSGDTLSYTSTEMGPKIGFLFGKRRVYGIYLVYNLIGTAKYDDSTSTAEWRGTTMKYELAYMPEIKDNLNIGFKLNVYQANFSEQITESTTLSKENNKRAIIYPTMSLAYYY